MFAFFVVPGPLTFELFARGASPATRVWLGIAAVGTLVAALLGRMPGTEPRPYVQFYGEDTPNPTYRRVCYTVGWGGVISFGLLNTMVVIDAVIGGEWRSQQIYQWGYFPIMGAVWALGAFGVLPRTRKSTQGEGVERRYFYGSVWAVAIAQPTLWILWKTLPAGQRGDVIKMLVYCGLLAGIGQLARRGILPRTRPILPGLPAMSD